MIDTLFNRDQNSQKLFQLIADYKSRVSADNNKDEVYKWQLIKKFQQTWDIDSSDFSAMLKRITFKNLVYYNARKVIVDVAVKYPKETRNSFNLLFNEQNPLQDRIADFQQTIRALYTDLGFAHLPTHQDERTIGTYLAFKYPEKYTFYKATFFDKLAVLLQFKKEAVGKIYIQYLDFVQAFIQDFIFPDAELLAMKQSFLDDTCHSDENHLILAQDILYQMLDKPQGRSYWKIGSKAGSNGKSIWPEMKINNIISIGWSDLGNLESRGIIKKKDLAAELLSRKQYTAKSSASRKAGEILDLYQQMQIGDVVAVCDGESVLALARIQGDYEFNSQLDFPHLRTVEWLAEPEKFRVSDGPLTTVFKLTNPLIIASIDKIIDNPSIMPTPETSAKSGNSGVNNIILYGPPGTGKTYNTIDLAVELATGSKHNDHGKNKDAFNDLVKAGQVEFITFHQNYSYEDFVIGIKPDLQSSADLKFKRNEGILYRMAKKAEKNFLQSQNDTPATKEFEQVFNEFLTPLVESGQEIEVKMASGKASFWITEINPNNLEFRKQSGGTDHTLSIDTIRELYEGKRDFTSGLRYYYQPLLNILWEKGKQNIEAPTLKNYVLIIDEINRANISRVFGELITLLEEDKRLGADNELSLTLPNGEENFSLPPNLYILGTMNAADKSIALVDIALRRRFDFRGFYPTKTIINELASNNMLHPDAPTILNAINDFVYEKKGADYLIGHAYFIKKITEPELDATLRRKVIPLLMEYFSGKTKLVEESFAQSGYRVSYNRNDFDWDISKG